MTVRTDRLGAAELRRPGGLEVLVWPGLGALGVDAVVTTRAGGVSTGPYESLNLGFHVGDDPVAVAENRRRAAGALGAALDDCVFGAQVHGTRAAVVTGDDAGRGARSADDAVADTDVLVTTTPGPVLVTLVADCAPVLLVDPEAGVLATVHAGWRGTARGVCASAVASMSLVGARPDRTVAMIGPTVSPTTYEVGDDVAGEVRACLGDRAPRVLTPWAADRWLFDLVEANRLQFHGAGVAAVATTPYTTADRRFFSHRRARPCGRFGLLARLR